MTRPKSPRSIAGVPQVNWFKPAGIHVQNLQEVVLKLDEIEALRLADLEGNYQDQVADEMSVSRQTVGRILANAHHKIADALVNGKSIRLEGGIVKCKGSGHCCDNCVLLCSGEEA